MYCSITRACRAAQRLLQYITNVSKTLLGDFNTIFTSWAVHSLYMEL